ncbi:hypothetical protein QYH69_31160 [Paraburkholderia sp. SARCC-3016]|uniref:hypothetical protein n=1 Tax=Paraburkholderia sp. SARCC-3016 TaxID=3058611 RepID=UPI002809DF45|nr:hypothetical protein [Paraburkholderia sp. SARCC-3016]MDQ7981686.1 hypothetical protein [Paraburkholderia sp. SARCC-3016]
MNTKIIATVLVAASAALAAPAFASGYGPAPFYHPSTGAPASQRGQSEQTLSAEAKQWNDNSTAYGGVRSGSSEAGSRAASRVDTERGFDSSLFRHH